MIIAFGVANNCNKKQIIHVILILSRSEKIFALQKLEEKL